MTEERRESDVVKVLIRVLDLLELDIRHNGLSNSDAVQINQVVNQFHGTSTGTFIQARVGLVKTEITMADEYNIGDHAQIGAVGKGAHVDHVVFGMADGSQSEISAAALLEELGKLRLEMRRQATTSEEDKSIVAIGDAIASIEEGDTPRMLGHLRSAGKWAFGIATAIGTGVAAAAIKAALGV
jgi:hypothetical protein